MGFREKLQRILISVWPFLEWTKTLDRSFKFEKTTGNYGVLLATKK